MTLHEYPSDPDNPGDTHPEVPERIIRTYEVVSSQFDLHDFGPSSSPSLDNPLMGS